MPKCGCNTSGSDVATGNGVASFSWGWKWGFPSRLAKARAKDQAMTQYNKDLTRAKASACKGIPGCGGEKCFCKNTVGTTPIGYTYTSATKTIFGKTFNWGGTWSAGISNTVTGDCWN